MENKKLYIAIGIVAVIIFALVVAIIVTDEKEEKNSNKTTITNQSKVSNVNNTANENNNTQNVDYAISAEIQMAAPKSGDTIAIMHVKDFGDITFKFFEDKAPKAVENFLTHAKDGYYNGVKFHRVMEEFMIQSGDPKGDGTGGESIWGKGFEEEIDASLVPYRGALCMASTGYGKSSLGSQFFIVQANATDNMAKTLSQYGYPEDLVQNYSQYGGYMSLYGMYTVFGQVIEGMDIVDRIVKVEKKFSQTGELSSPVEDIIIESIEVKTQE